MSSLQLVNANADIIRKAQALGVNINAAKGLQEVLKTNLGPKGTIKMLVGGAGQAVHVDRTSSEAIAGGIGRPLSIGLQPGFKTVPPQSGNQ